MYRKNPIGPEGRGETLLVLLFRTCVHGADVEMQSWFVNEGVVVSQALASAIASTQVMKAQQVVKGENGDEVSRSYSNQYSRSCSAISEQKRRGSTRTWFSREGVDVVILVIETETRHDSFYHVHFRRQKMWRC